MSKSELGRPYVSLKPLVSEPIRYTLPLLRPGGERRGERRGDRPAHERAPVQHHRLPADGWTRRRYRGNHWERFIGTPAVTT